MLNSITLMGRLVADPEYRTSAITKTETSSFSLAVSVNKEDTLFIDCKCFNANAVKCLHKGDKIAIEGRLNQRDFERKDGSKGRAYEILVNTIEFAEVKKPAEDNSVEK